MDAKQKLVAVISPWEQLPQVVKKKFRVESLPEEKKVMVWRDDLQTDEDLEAELKAIGITAIELRRSTPTEWKTID